MNSIERNYLNNGNNHGSAGMAFEVALREALKGIIEPCHGARQTDIVVKRGVALECKSGCGWLAEPVEGYGYESREYAEKALGSIISAIRDGEKNVRLMKRAQHVAYIEKYDGTNLGEARIMSQRSFILLLADYNLIRVKQSKSSGLWGFAIQSYIPTPTFRASRARYESFKEARNNRGITIEEYATKMKIAKGV